MTETEYFFPLPTSASFKRRYGMNMLYSLGYLFQDRYNQEMHHKFMELDDESFYRICLDLKKQLEENHCYSIQQIFHDFDNDIKNERRTEEQYSIGHISITPLRIVYHERRLTIGNRALRMAKFGGEENFLYVHIREEDGQLLDEFDASMKNRLKWIMLDGIHAMGKRYRFFGS